VKDLVISRNVVSNCNQITNNAALAPGCIGIVGCAGNISIDRNICSDGKWSNLYINNVNARGSGKLTVRNNTLTNSVKENLFCANTNNAIFHGNYISSDETAKLTTASFRSVKDITFEKNKIMFRSSVNHDGLFLFQSSRLRIVNNQIITSNPVSINRIEEVKDSIIEGNIYTSANPASQEIIRFSRGKNNKFTNNILKKNAGGKRVTYFDR
jgi:hypothetical protein